MGVSMGIPMGIPTGVVGVPMGLPDYPFVFPGGGSAAPDPSNKSA